MVVVYRRKYLKHLWHGKVMPTDIQSDIFSTVTKITRTTTMTTKSVTYGEPYLGSNYLCDLNLKNNPDRRNDAFKRTRTLTEKKPTIQHCIKCILMDEVTDRHGNG